MFDKRVPSLHDRRIVGTVSRADLLTVLASAGAKTAYEQQDRRIRRQLLAGLREQKWADPSEGHVVSSPTGLRILGSCRIGGGAQSTAFAAANHSSGDVTRPKRQPIASGNAE